MKKDSFSSNLRFLSISVLLLVGSFCSYSALAGGNQTYASRSQFEASTTGNKLYENFDTCSSWQEVHELFKGVVKFSAPYPLSFYGWWEGQSTSGEFAGSGLLPNPTFQSKPLSMEFPTPVFGVGANVFDDFDGSSWYNVITLTVTTTLGETFSITESFSDVGDCGFLGATSSDGIISAEFSIDNSDANLEVDLLSVLEQVPCTDTDGDGICDEYDSCPTTANTDQADEDCDGSGNVCDICPGGDDTQDTDGDGTPDCADWDGMASLSAEFTCGNNGNKVLICHNGNTLCISPNAVETRLAQGDYIGTCNTVSCGSGNISAPLGVIENVELEKVRMDVFPNPTDGKFSLIFEEALVGNSVLKIADVTGRIVAEESIEVNRLSHPVSVTNLPKGMYHVQVLENDVLLGVKELTVN